MHIEWKGNAGAQNGSAHITIEDHDLFVRLECIADYVVMRTGLELAFDEGKRCVTDSIRSHIKRAIDQAVIDHVL